jgi:NAD(P) transhydrogenase subunit alpha
MKLGIPAETKPNESRVAATPETVKKLTAAGKHAVLVQAGAGTGASIPDDQYVAAGGTIVPTAAQVYGDAQIVLKVRAPRFGRARTDERGSDPDRAAAAT